MDSVDCESEGTNNDHASNKSISFYLLGNYNAIHKVCTHIAHVCSFMLMCACSCLCVLAHAHMCPYMVICTVHSYVLVYDHVCSHMIVYELVDNHAY